ncbi:histidine phosphatase family protein [Celerinatantimonas yamalensis]|uniref:Histidine phosphatase family protein n=1 Tax=Celerinatantimonas yamalensis TaxID=559956 RepID=A0ABW9G8Q0_9GAMM
MPVKQLYIIRHGQTEFNSEQRLQGQCNSPLTPLGEQQAQSVGLSLAAQADIDTFALIASPLGRARQTAQWIAKALGQEAPSIRFDERLMEFALGDWESLPAPEIKALHPEFIDSKDWYLRAPKAESLSAVKQRVNAFLNDPKTPEKAIVVSHALTGSVLRALLIGLDDTQIFEQPRPQDSYFYVVNGQLTQIFCESEFI